MSNKCLISKNKFFDVDDSKVRFELFKFSKSPRTASGILLPSQCSLSRLVTS